VPIYARTMLMGGRPGTPDNRTDMTSHGGALRLRPVTADEFPSWIAASETGYALGIELHGGQTHAAAQRKAADDTAAVLPLGLDTPGHALFVVEADDRPVGRLWLAERESGGRRMLFVYDISIDDAFQGRGYGRAAMRLAEDEARARGLGRIELNVFGGNAVARTMYRSLGYVEKSVQMAKDLDAP
jgi:GNAT superfamily N-acetyltransferase